MSLDRFHQKYHAKNHHTNATPGYPDSAFDPIANPNNPFQGDFYLNGSLSAHNIYTDNFYVSVLSTGNIKTSVRSLSTTYQMLTSDRTILITNGTIILPVVSAVSTQDCYIKQLSSGTVVISATPPNLIDGSLTTYTLSTQFASIHLQAFGSSWWILDTH